MDFEPIISRIANKFHLSTEEYRYIAESVVAPRGGCNMLVFGVGRDSELWLLVNQGGRTVFIEDSAEWIDKVREKLPEIDVRRVEYHTTRSRWREMLEGDPADLELELPDDVAGERWDVIFIDGPPGFMSTCPGRMKSIYTASVLASRSGGADVIVHDCDREVERAYCDRFFPNGDLVSEFDRTRHYRTVSRSPSGEKSTQQ